MSLGVDEEKSRLRILDALRHRFDWRCRPPAFLPTQDQSREHTDNSEQGYRAAQVEADRHIFQFNAAGSLRNRNSAQCAINLIDRGRLPVHAGAPAWIVNLT